MTATQTITPELRQWIIAQAEAGHPPDTVLAAMRASGWTEDTAIAAMESTLQAHLAGRPAAQALPPAVPVPGPDLAGSPLYLDAGDRRVHVILSKESPRIVVFGDVLSDEECDELIAQARPRLARSLTVATRTGGEELNEDRTSSGMFFRRGETPVVARLEQRLARLVNWPLENGEGLQILNYRPGAEYKPHYDYFDPNEPGTPTILRRGGQRVGTVVVYLSEPEQGGGTTFPDVGLEVAPKRGNAVFFAYERPHPSTRTLHGGAPVIAGEKWIATKWLRERRFD
ncbi:2OG-Fe(II) oxygenase [Ramlibacter sp. MAHUQ-53]|uniref:2OG-Fe(II) oxygenase n=1 Tax=unclassified Ramlibacter TaxID=2617605 RepID=UPI00363CD48F